jgi:nucleotide-binding universal stress UspA family protein
MGVEAHGDVVFAAAAGNLVEDPQASTVVVGASGRTGPIAGVLGSVTTAVAHRAEVPVVVVPAMWEGEAMKKIVVGLDGSATSDAALRWAVEEARLGGAELVAVHVWSYPYSGGPREAMRQDAQQQLDESLAAADAGKVTAKLIEGHVAGALIDESADADLLVVGSHGRGGFTSMLLGSVSRTAVQHAKCPVAVIRRQK